MFMSLSVNRGLPIGIVPDQGILSINYVNDSSFRKLNLNRKGSEGVISRRKKKKTLKVHRDQRVDSGCANPGYRIPRPQVSLDSRNKAGDKKGSDGS